LPRNFDFGAPAQKEAETWGKPFRRSVNQLPNGARLFQHALQAFGRLRIEPDELVLQPGNVV